MHAHTHIRTQRRRSRRCSKSSNVVPKCHYRHLNDVLLVFVFPTDQQQQQRHKMDACVRARLCVRECVSVCVACVCLFRFCTFAFYEYPCALEPASSLPSRKASSSIAIAISISTFTSISICISTLSASDGQPACGLWVLCPHPGRGPAHTHRLPYSFAHARARFHFICQAGEARLAEPKTCAFYFGNSSDGND